MATVIPTERSTYAPIINFLEDLGFIAHQELKKEEGILDILLKYNDELYVLEIKIAENEKKTHSHLIEGIVQAYGYGQKQNTENIIAIVYPKYYRKQRRLDSIKELTIDVRTEILSLTKYWYSKERLSIKEFFQRLKEKIEGNESSLRTVSFIVDVLQTNVKKLSNNLLSYYVSKEDIKELIDIVGENHELFLSLGNFDSIEEFTEKEKFVAIDLISYLLINQILFYSIYTRLTQKTPSFDKNLNSLKDLNYYFEKLKEIDYKPIYKIDIINNNLIPDIPLFIKDINETIELIKIIKPELVRHDLFGRIFHRLLPPRTRKVLSAFYTGTSSSEILAGLTIRDWRSSVWDIACGSGTLLASAYLFKKELYERFQHVTANELQQIHKTYIEEHITGTDLMPFACHLAGISLSTLNVAVTTDDIRIAHINSLDCYKNIGKKTAVLRRASDTISEQIKKTKRPIRVLSDFEKKDEDKYIMNLESDNSGFPINRVDVVLMNPPFTDRNKMPKKYRESLFSYEKLGKKCGHEVNLWGYFLALADEVTKNNGRIGAIVPMNLLRGYNTRKIREFILNKYHIEYIIKSIADFSFTEDSNYKDIMIIMEKRKPEYDDKTGFVLIKNSIHGLPITETHIIRDKIQAQNSKESLVGDDLDIYWADHNDIISHKDNLMPFIYTKSYKNKQLIDSFLNEIKIKSNKLDFIKKHRFKEGIKSPKNFKNYYYLTHNIDKNRIKRSFLFFDFEDDKKVIAEIKRKSPISIAIEKNVLYPSIRTSTGLKSLDITNVHDYIILKEYEQFNKFLNNLKEKEKAPAFSWTEANNIIKRADDAHLFVPNRIQLFSQNTYLLCLFSDIKKKPTNSFFSLKDNKDNSKIISLSMNSIITICQFLQLVSASFGKGKYFEASVSDWGKMLQIDPNKLSVDEKNELLSLFGKLKDVEFPPLIQQIKDFNEHRLLLDKTILKIIGFAPSYIEKTLPKIYETIIDELSI